jgi:hypothetical protein
LNGKLLVVFWVSILSLVFNTAPPIAFGSSADTTQTEPPQTVYKYVSKSDATTFPILGAGIGIPYGIIGLRGGPEFARWSPTIGIGLVPFDWSAAFTVSGTVYFNDRTKTVRPKITLAYSNAAAIAVILNGDQLSDPLFSKVYSGFACYFGIDWRFTKQASYTLEIGIGGAFPLEGIDQVNDDLKEAQASYLSQGYIIEDYREATSFPVIYLGLVYNPGRTMMLKKTEG